MGINSSSEHTHGHICMVYILTNSDSSPLREDFHVLHFFKVEEGAEF